MFSKSQIDAYQKVVAPDELYEKIQNANYNKRLVSFNSAMKFAAVAACFAVVMTIGLLSRVQSPNVIINGLEIESSVEFYDVSPAMEMRSSPIYSIPVEIEVDKSATISVSEGVMTVDEKAPGSELDISESATVWWNIERAEEMPECQMKIDDERNTTIITLEFDEAERKITARKIVE